MPYRIYGSTALQRLSRILELEYGLDCEFASFPVSLNSAPEIVQRMRWEQAQDRVPDALEPLLQSRRIPTRLLRTGDILGEYRALVQIQSRKVYVSGQYILAEQDLCAYLDMLGLAQQRVTEVMASLSSAANGTSERALRCLSVFAELAPEMQAFLLELRLYRQSDDEVRDSLREIQQLQHCTPLWVLADNRETDNAELLYINQLVKQFCQQHGHDYIDLNLLRAHASTVDEQADTITAPSVDAVSAVRHFSTIQDADLKAIADGLISMASKLDSGDRLLSLPEPESDPVQSFVAAVPPFAPHIPAIFSSLSAMNRSYLLQQNHSAANAQQLQAFFEFVERQCDDAAYYRVQSRHLNTTALRWIAQRVAKLDALGDGSSNAEKYLHFPYWAAAKLLLAKNMGLSSARRMSILDIGSGPGHFGLVCHYLGHEYRGLDIPSLLSNPYNDNDLFGDLCQVFGISRRMQKIQPFTPLQSERRFDMVTGLMVTFCCDWSADPVATRIWGEAEWQYFVDDLIVRILKPEFKVFLQLNKRLVTAEIFDMFARAGALCDQRRCTISFDKVLRWC